MLDKAPMPQYPEAISPQEVIDFLSAPKATKRQLNVRLTDEAHRILEEECKRFGAGRANTIEALFREIRELRKKARKK